MNTSGSNISVDYGNVFPTGGEGCIEMWLKAKEDSSTIVRTYSTIYDAASGSTLNRFLLYWRPSIGGFQALWTGTGFPTVSSGAISYNTGDIFHIAFVWKDSGIDGGSDTMRIYKDGSQIASSTASITTTGLNRTVGLGEWIDNASFYGGFTHDNMKIFNYDKITFEERFNEGFGYQRIR
jgi:hypothetical protein